MPCWFLYFTISKILLHPGNEWYFHSTLKTAFGSKQIILQISKLKFREVKHHANVHLTIGKPGLVSHILAGCDLI